ncbi:hypothetical protein GCM10012275_42840 [Longimycelium tulufanense]|uniref:Uncharacterized protein n=1 Tax=Longimycelium tulufanense TaxID=907463 RepID=A0A8J3CIQ5_9PSEU|nr:hypothetical protein [Longimycelium tulufanense]GGM67677.1 hypothetical protein GCM10012275_42840 [Longimycelium tulufanense]
MSQPSGRVRVYHNLSPAAMVFGYGRTDRCVLVYAYDEPIPTPAPSDLDRLERIFELFNVGKDPEFGTPDRRAVDYRARGNRSLSVGDVVALDDRVYACAATGWVAIAPPPVEGRSRPGTTPFTEPAATDR